MGFPCASAGKESACNAEDLGSIPGLGRSPGEGKGYPLQYSGLENSMDCTVLLLLLLLLSRFSRVRLCATPRRQPTRLPRPRDSLGKNTGVGCHFLLQGSVFSHTHTHTQRKRKENAAICSNIDGPWGIILNQMSDSKRQIP